MQCTLSATVGGGSEGRARAPRSEDARGTVPLLRATSDRTVPDMSRPVTSFLVIPLHIQCCVDWKAGEAGCTPYCCVCSPSEETWGLNRIDDG